jgi:hypothetical protein
LILPLSLLAWLAFAPLRSVVGLWLQVIATGLALLALAWGGMWLLPPWWTPWLFWALWIALVALAFQDRRTPRYIWPGQWREWGGVVVLVLLGGYAATVTIDAYIGRVPIAREIVELSFPLGGGPYFVTSGGSSESVNAHMLTLNPISERMAAYRGQSFGVDIVKLDSFGLRARGLQPRNPGAYHIFGEPIYAPCDGTVLHAEGGLADLDVPETDRDHMAGNHILLTCGEAVVLMAHMRQGSVAVVSGQMVRTGDHIGAVGNTGNSDEPHLHIHAQRPGTPDAPLSGEPLQIRIGGRFLVRNDRFSVPVYERNR